MSLDPSKKCEKLWLTFKDSDYLFSKFANDIKKSERYGSFQPIVLNIDAVGAVRKRKLETYDIEFELKKIIKIEVSEEDPEKFHEDYIGKYLGSVELR